MASLSFKILPTRRKSSGKLGIYLSLTHLRQTRYISTEFEVENENQFKNGKVCNRKDATILNRQLDELLSKYSDKLNLLNLPDYSNCATLKDALLNRPETFFLCDLLTLRVERLKNEGRDNYARMNKETLKVVCSILGNPDISKLTRDDIKTLFQSMQKRGYSAGSMQMRLAHLKAALNEAIENRIVYFVDHPFNGFKMPRPGIQLRDITIEEFQKIREFKPGSKRADFARDMFLLSFYLGGINLVDLLESDLSGAELRYNRRKTRDKKTGESQTVLTIPIEARPLIEKHAPNGVLIWPGKKEYILIMSYINTCFSKLKKEAGITSRLSFYSARKTFAQFAFMLGIKTEIIEYCLGQTMKTNRPIYNYVRVMQRQADAAIYKVIDYTKNPETYNLNDLCL